MRSQSRTQVLDAWVGTKQNSRLSKDFGERGLGRLADKPLETLFKATEHEPAMAKQEVKDESLRVKIADVMARGLKAVLASTAENLIHTIYNAAERGGAAVNLEVLESQLDAICSLTEEVRREGQRCVLAGAADAAALESNLRLFFQMVELALEPYLRNEKTLNVRPTPAARRETKEAKEPELINLIVDIRALVEAARRPEVEAEPGYKKALQGEYKTALAVLKVASCDAKGRDLFHDSDRLQRHRDEIFAEAADSLGTIIEDSDKSRLESKALITRQLKNACLRVERFDSLLRSIYPLVDKLKHEGSLSNAAIPSELLVAGCLERWAVDCQHVLEDPYEFGRKMVADIKGVAHILNAERTALAVQVQSLSGCCAFSKKTMLKNLRERAGRLRDIMEGMLEFARQYPEFQGSQVTTPADLLKSASLAHMPTMKNVNLGALSEKKKVIIRKESGPPIRIKAKEPRSVDYAMPEAGADMAATSSKDTPGAGAGKPATPGSPSSGVGASMAASSSRRVAPMPKAEADQAASSSSKVASIPKTGADPAAAASSSSKGAPKLK